jgi:hypothetical protein
MPFSTSSTASGYLLHGQGNTEISDEDDVAASETVKHYEFLDQGKATTAPLTRSITLGPTPLTTTTSASEPGNTVEKDYIITL